MNANPVFEKHRRQLLITALFEHERSLIREACARAVGQATDQPIAMIQAAYAEEEDRAIAWCAWLLNQCDNEFVGSLDHRELDEPRSPCAPRSRRLWMSKLGDDVKLMKGDTLWEMMIAFVAGFIVAQFTGVSGPMRRERDVFERELCKRLRLADEGGEKEEAAGAAHKRNSRAEKR